MSIVSSASAPTRTVYTKTRWSGTWIEQPLVVPMSITSQAAPGHSSATIRLRYGVGRLPAIGSRAADSSPATITRGGLIGNYLKIVVSGLGTWFGVILDNSDSRIGESSGGVPQGTEVYTAFGLTWFLDQYPITQSKVKQSSNKLTIDRAIPFNAGTGDTTREHRGALDVTWKNYDSGQRCFTDRIQTTSPAAWKAADAVDYLLREFPPVNSFGDTLIPFRLNSSARSFLDYELPPTSYDGQTPWAILNRLIDRRRGLGWHAEIVGDAVELVVWSQTAVPVSLPGNGMIPANPNRTTYDFDQAVNVQQATVSTTLMTRYDQVVAVGQRAGSVFSVRPQSNFETDWTTEQKNTYNTAASGRTGYGAMTEPDKEAANADERANDENARVFSWWKLKADWNGRADTDPTSATHNYAFPRIDEDGSDNTARAAVVQQAGLRIHTTLPLKHNVDYTGTVTPDTATGDAKESDLVRPLLAFKASNLRSDASDAGWIHCERMNAAVDAGSSKRTFKYSVDLAVRDNLCGLELRVVGGQQHFIAKDLYVANGTFENIPTGEGIDHDDWIATIYVQQESRCQSMYPATNELPPLDFVRRLRLPIDDARLDYLVPGTVVGVDQGGLKKTSGGWLRDDRKRLQNVARMAFAWYGVQRRTLQLSFRALVSGFNLGHLITSIGSGANLESINTAVTSVTYDLEAGTTSLSTSFGEIDFVGADS